MTKQLITVGNETFANKEALRERCRSIIGGHRIGVAIEGSESDFLHALIERHPESALKVREGVKYFYVAWDGHGKECLWLMRLGGTCTHFSFIACVTPKTVRSDVLAAMRTAIEPQVTAFRDAMFRHCPQVTCALSGEVVTKRGSHVDHELPFVQLAERFIARHLARFDSIKVNAVKDGSMFTYMTDPVQCAAWQAYHAQFAVLRITTAKANLSRPRKAR